VLPTLLTLLSAVAVHPAFAVLAVSVGLVLAKVIALKLELASLGAQIRQNAANPPIEGRNKEAMELALKKMREERDETKRRMDVLIKRKEEALEKGSLGAAFALRDQIKLLRGEYEGYAEGIDKVIKGLRKMDEAKAASIKTTEDLAAAERKLREVWASGKFAEDPTARKRWAEGWKGIPPPPPPPEPRAAGSAFASIEGMSRRLQEAVFRKDQEKETINNTAAIKDNTKELKQFPFALETIAESWAVNTGMTMGP